MTALERAIADPVPVTGFGDRSPMDGLARRSLSFGDVLGQSVSAVAPSAAATTTPLLVAVVAGGATIWAITVAMAVSLLVAITINQFTSRMAATGSLYTFVTRGIGRTAGVATGVSLLLGYSFIAMFALAGAGYYLLILLDRFAPGISDSSLLAAAAVTGLSGIVTLVMLRGVRVSSRVTLLVESASVVIILGLVATLLVQSGPAIHWDVLSPSSATPTNLAVGAVLAITAFVGFESSATLSVEAARPFARAPRAIMWTVIASGLLYILTSYSQLVGFSMLGQTLSNSPSPINDLARSHGVEWMGLLLDVSIATSFVACAIASITAMTRVLFTMGREGLIPSRFGQAHPRFQTPHVAIVWSVPIVTIVPTIAVATGVGLWETMETLIVVAAAGYITAYILTCIAAPVFLRRIGEATVGVTVIAIIAATALAAALGIYLTVESGTVRWIGVAVFLSGLAAGFILYAMALSRRPWVRVTIGSYDEPTASDVLGGMSDDQGDSTLKGTVPGPAHGA